MRYDTSKECITVVIGTSQLRSGTSYFIPNLFYIKLILYSTYCIPNILHAELILCRIYFIANLFIPNFCIPNLLDTELISYQSLDTELNRYLTCQILNLSDTKFIITCMGGTLLYPRQIHHTMR